MPVVRGGARRGSAALAALFAFVAGCHATVTAPPSPPASVASAVSTASAAPAVTPPSRPTARSPIPTTARAPAPTTVTVTSTPPTSPTVGPTADLPVGVAPGASGIAAAPTPGNWYVVDDARNTSEVVEVTASGKLVRRVPIADMSARNAEALAEGRCAGSAGRCLFVGDIGDNASQRDDVVVYEATLSNLKLFSGAPVPAAAWHYTYPDGPHNAEAMVVAPSGTLVIITKSAPDQAGHVPPHRIYRGEGGGGQLTFVAQFTPPNPLVPLQSLLTGTVVTDASYDGKRLLLLTYDEVVVYTAPTANVDPAGFPTWPRRAWPHPPLVQTEGIAGLGDGCGYIVASEEGPGGTQAALASVSC